MTIRLKNLDYSRMKKIVSALFLIFHLGYLPAQEDQLPGFVRDSIDGYILTAMSGWQIPGVSVAIVKDSRVVFLKGYGVREAGKKEAVDENTVFMIGSNTKAFTATALAMLEEEGKLSLNDKATKWMPEFKLKDPLATKEITIRDMLCHRIGFETFQGDFTYWTSKLNRAEVMQKMSLIDPLYGFRAQWGYCNAAFLAAGEIIPLATGKSWEETVKEKIVKPLKMERTCMLSEELSKVSNAAIPHTLVNGKLVKLPYPLIDNLAPAASMSSSAKDMCHWLIAQLDSGRFEGEKVIPQEAIAATRVPQSIIKTDPRDSVKSHFYLYGLGFLVSDRDGKIVVSHTGGVDGFVTSVMMVPEEKLGIVVLTNTDQNNFFQNLSSEIRDAFLGLPFGDYSRLSLGQFMKEESAHALWLDSLHKIIAKRNTPPVELKKFSGIYTNPVYGEIEVRAENSGLVIYFSNHPGMTGKLEYIQGASFLCIYSNPTMGIKEISFAVDNENVTGLTLRVADFVEFTPYEFTRKN